MDKIKLKNCRKEVKEFAIEMEKELLKNDHKPGWKNDSIDSLFERLEEETSELYNSIWTDETFMVEEPAKEAVDIANFAMMIWDIIKINKPRK